MQALGLKSLWLALGLACLLAPAWALADDGRDEGTVIALTPAQAETAMEAAMEAGAKAHAAALDGSSTQKRQIHGEVGMSMGTGGYRSVNGTVVAPLGDTGSVAISVADGQMSQIGRRP